MINGTKTFHRSIEYCELDARCNVPNSAFYAFAKSCVREYIN